MNKVIVVIAAGCCCCCCCIFTDEGSVEELAVILEGLEFGDEFGVDSTHTAGHLSFA